MSGALASNQYECISEHWCGVYSQLTFAADAKTSRYDDAVDICYEIARDLNGIQKNVLVAPFSDEHVNYLAEKIGKEQGHYNKPIWVGIERLNGTWRYRDTDQNK